MGAAGSTCRHTGRVERPHLEHARGGMLPVEGRHLADNGLVEVAGREELPLPDNRPTAVRLVGPPAVAFPGGVALPLPEESKVGTPAHRVVVAGEWRAPGAWA